MSNRDRLVLGSGLLREDALTPRLLERFHDGGGRALDLANAYGDGEAERAIGRWLAASGAELTLYVKGCAPPRCRRELVGAEVDRARRELGRDLLDVFLLHRDDLAVPVTEFGEALLREVERGSIRGFGVSNWTLERFQALRAELGSESRHLVAFSNHFSLAEMVRPAWPGCLAMGKSDIAVLVGVGVSPLAWASLATGYFAGRHCPAWTSEENARRRERARQLAQEKGTTPTAVALAYVLEQPGEVLAVVGTRSEAHLADLLTAATLELTPEELAWLERGSDPGPRTSSRLA